MDFCTSHLLSSYMKKVGQVGRLDANYLSNMFHFRSEYTPKRLPMQLPTLFQRLEENTRFLPTFSNLHPTFSRKLESILLLCSLTSSNLPTFLTKVGNKRDVGAISDYNPTLPSLLASTSRLTWLEGWLGWNVKTTFWLSPYNLGGCPVSIAPIQAG